MSVFRLVVRPSIKEKRKSFRRGKRLTLFRAMCSMTLRRKRASSPTSHASFGPRTIRMFPSRRKSRWLLRIPFVVLGRSISVKGIGRFFLYFQEELVNDVKPYNVRTYDAGGRPDLSKPLQHKNLGQSLFFIITHYISTT